jgi:hypothetical protein
MAGELFSSSSPFATKSENLGVMKPIHRYVIVALLALVFLFVSKTSIELPNIVTDTSRELFIALIAALAIAYIIDNPSREHLRTEISSQIALALRPLEQASAEIKDHALKIEEDSYKTAFAGRMPRDFVDSIQTKAFKHPFVRENFRAVWRLELQDDKMLIANVDTSFVLNNLTEIDQKYEPRFFFDQRVVEPKVNKFVINGVSQDLSAIRPEPAAEGEPDVVMNFSPLTIQGRGHVDISSDFAFKRSLTDYEIWSTLYPCRSMSLRVYYPTACKAEYFKVEQLGDLALRINKMDTYIDVDVQDKILPDQGLVFSWRFSPL